MVVDLVLPAGKDARLGPFIGSHPNKSGALTCDGKRHCASMETYKIANAVTGWYIGASRVT